MSATTRLGFYKSTPSIRCPSSARAYRWSAVTTSIRSQIIALLVHIAAKAGAASGWGAGGAPDPADQAELAEERDVMTSPEP